MKGTEEHEEQFTTIVNQKKDSGELDDEAILRYLSLRFNLAGG
jgi:hypothetical protein